MDKPAFLNCQLSDGQFSDEYAVGFTDYCGQSRSLFTHRSNASAINGLRVTVVEDKGELVLIRLPSELLEPGGYFVTVHSNQLQDTRP